MAKFLVTGGAGFIGGNFLHLMVNKYPNDQYVCLDALTYAGNIKTLEQKMNKPNFKFVHENICNREEIYKLFEKEHFDYVINFAAESHVDRSINNPEIFLKTNVLGVEILLDACRKYGIKRYHQVSTDEVYGDSYKNIYFDENSKLNPSSPYSVSKAAADMLVLSYHKTYNLPITISRSCNNYGPYQHSEKMIPLMILKALKNEKLPVYGNGLNIRDWIYVEDTCQAIDIIVRNGKNGEIYNISGHNEKQNLDVIKTILIILNKSENLISYVKDRPGHDLKYSMISKKIESKLGWKLKYNFEIGLKYTIDWYLRNQDWTNSF